MQLYLIGFHKLYLIMKRYMGRLWEVVGDESVEPEGFVLTGDWAGCYGSPATARPRTPPPLSYSLSIDERVLIYQHEYRNGQMHYHFNLLEMKPNSIYFGHWHPLELFVNNNTVIPNSPAQWVIITNDKWIFLVKVIFLFKL